MEYYFGICLEKAQPESSTSNQPWAALSNINIPHIWLYLNDLSCIAVWSSLLYFCCWPFWEALWIPSGLIYFWKMPTYGRYNPSYQCTAIYSSFNSIYSLLGRDPSCTRLGFLKSDKSELGWLSQESGVTREWSNYWSKKRTLLWSKRLCISGPKKKDYTLRNLNYIFCKRGKMTSNQLQLGDTSFVSPHARILCFRQGLAMEVAKVTSCDQLYKNQSLIYNNILEKIFKCSNLYNIIITNHKKIEIFYPFSILYF